MPTPSWNNRILQWLDKRIPSQRRFQLGMNSIFIFPSKFGLLFIGLCVGLFVLGSNYNNNLLLLVCFFLVSLFLINLSASYSNFAKIQVQLGRISSVFAGEDASFPIWFGHEGGDEHPLPYRGKLYVKRYQEKVQASFDPALNTNPIDMPFGTLKRGKQPVPRITLESYFPLGLYRCWSHLKFQGEIVVYPKPVRFNGYLPINSEDSDEEENEKGRHDQFGMEDFETLTPYRTGEPLHKIAWKQLAKGQGLVSKQFSSTSSQWLWFSLKAIPTQDVELALSYLTWLVMDAHKRNEPFGLDLGTQKISPNTGTEHLDACLYALAMYGENLP